MKNFLAISAFFSLAFLAGCVTKTGSATWWNPTTWGSTREAARVESRLEKKDDARELVIKSAQKSAVETDTALQAAPASRPVEVAKESSAQTVTLLSQVAGPLTAEESGKIRMQIAGLLSDNAKLRAEGEALRDKARAEAEALSNRLQTAEEKLAAALEKLPAAQRREAETANKYRNLLFVAWAVGALAVIGYAGLLYLKIAYGGIPAAIGKGLSSMRETHPDAAKIATGIFDDLLDRAEKKKIKKATISP